MAFFDMSPEQLEEYRPPRDEPGDFDLFWQKTLSDARRFPINARFEPVDYLLETVDTFDVTFNGYAGQPIKGWLLMPRHRKGPLPCVVEYIGYGGGRGFPTDWLTWSSAGFAHLVMDTRGQGGTWLRGDTPDIDPHGGSPQSPGFLTRGILDPNTYYYRRLITDAVRAVEAARTHPEVDTERIAVAGTSQGGGLALAAGGLLPGTVGVVLSDVPFLCHYRRASEITDADPYREIARFCVAQRDRVETAFKTLSYFDGVNFAPRVTAQSLFSVGLMDEICPPSTVFAAYNYLGSSKEMRVWRYNNHEGGGSHQVVEKLRYLRKVWK